jgi:hypothetical protein
VSGGSSASHYAERVLKKVSQGRLPMDIPDRVYGGSGSDGPCDGCDDLIPADQVEYELHFGPVVYRLHLVCADLLRALARGREKRSASRL